MSVGRKRTCDCGACPKCRSRQASARWYQKHFANLPKWKPCDCGKCSTCQRRAGRQRIYQRSKESRRRAKINQRQREKIARAHTGREPSDEELDRRALAELEDSNAL